MNQIKGHALSLHMMAFLALSIFSVSNLFAWPVILNVYRDFSSHVLANSILNASLNRNMNPSVAPSYVLVTSAVNYVTSRPLKKANGPRTVAFILITVFVSVATSVASTSIYLAG